MTQLLPAPVNCAYCTTTTSTSSGGGTGSAELFTFVGDPNDLGLLPPDQTVWQWGIQLDELGVMLKGWLYSPILVNGQHWN